jgi:hypothetical protein
MLVFSPERKHPMFIEYINSILIDKTDKCSVWKIGDKIEINDDHDIVLFMQVIPNKCNEIVFKNTKQTNVFLCNTEQMSNYIDEFIHHIKPFFEYIQKNKYDIRFGIVDYSEANLRILKQHDFITSNNIQCHYIPYQYKKEEIDFLKSVKLEEKKVCTCGTMTERRANITQKLMSDNMIKIDPIMGFGDLRDKQLMKYRILVNLGVADDHNIYEHIRCDRLIFSGMIIVSEHRFDEKLLDIYDLVIWCDIDQLGEKIRAVIRNYEQYKKMITDEKINKISQERSKIYLSFRDLYTKTKTKS